MSDNNTTLGKAKRDIYIISENDRINNTKRKKTARKQHRKKISKNVKCQIIRYQHRCK